MTNILVEQLRRYGACSNDGYLRGPALQAAVYIENLEEYIVELELQLRKAKHLKQDAGTF